MTKNEDLKPCPFCDSAARIWECVPEKWRVFCTKPDCVVSVGLLVYTNREASITAWNTRPTVTPTDGDAEMALEALDILRECANGYRTIMTTTLSWELDKTIRTALQTRKTEWMNDTHACMNGDTEALKRTAEAMIKTPVPVDTISIKKEVLQGVREAVHMIKTIGSVSIKSVHDKNMAMHKLCSIRERAENCLASLDAVLGGE